MSAPTSLRGVFDPYASSTELSYDALETVPELQPGSLAVQTYAQMRRDARLAAVLAGYTLQIRRASWQVEPGGCRPDVVQQVADDLGLQVAGEDAPSAARTRGVSWNDHLRSALLSLTYGHMAFEMLAKVDDKKARLVALSERMPWTLEMIHADPKSGAFLGVSQTVIGKVDQPQIKADRMAFYCHDREATWYGTSLLRPSYAPWFLKRELMRVHATSARRFGMGVPTVEWVPSATPTPEQISAAQRLASAARVGDQSGASLPPGASLVLRGLSGGVPDVLGYIRYLDQQMAGAALMPHIELGTTESGSRALGSTFLDSWTLALGAIAEEIADVATRQIAARVVGWNWGEDEPVPRIVVSGVGTQREATAESLQMLLQAGALSAEPALEAWVRREYRLPEATPTPVAAPGVTLPGAPQPDGTAAPVPSTAASTDDGLIAAALAAANARNWGALDETAAQMQTRETATTTASSPSPEWTEIADDEGEDWKVDAALARGADVASAYKSIYGTGDDTALQRGYDVWAADQQVAGTPTVGTVDDFKALVTAAPAPSLTLDIDNRIVAVAVRLGRFSALIGQPITTCPYKGADAEQTALRRVWVTSYLRLRSADAPAPAATPADPTMKPTPAKPPAPPAAPPVPTVKASTRVLAAAGHPSSCAHATLGSVCHCPCGGVRHSWVGGDMPSGVKAPQSSSGDNTTAPGSGTRSGPLEGDDALNSTPLSLEREDNAPTGEQFEALSRYIQAGFIPINHLLRGGDVSTLGANALPEDTVQGWIDAMDSVMSDSPLPTDVVTWRGVTDGRSLFGSAYDGDLTGMEWREDAFTSTTTDPDMAASFTRPASGSPGPHATVMHITTPTGTGAIEMSDSSFESELLLERGLRMRVVRDYGVGPDGVRRLDVEVVPDAG